MANYYRKCSICGERHDTVTLAMYDGTEYNVCEKCASEHFKRSCVSGTWVLYDSYMASIDEVQDNYDLKKWEDKLNRLGLFMLASEWRRSYYFCDKCGLPKAPGMNCVSDNGNILNVCDDCLEEIYSDYTMCAECSTYFNPEYDNGEYDNGEYDNGGDYICSGCIDQSYVHCEDCGSLYRRESNNISFSERRDAWVCHRCWDSAYDDYEDDEHASPYVYEYGYKPEGIFHDTEQDTEGQTLYFGVENEMSHDDGEYQDDHSDYIYNHYDPNGWRESHFYQKSDSSLEHGIEIVSHPMSLSYWHSIYDHMDNVLRSSLDYTGGIDDGLHVHISRNGMTPTHERSFAMFAQFCRRGIETVARRRDNSYSRFIRASYMSDVYNTRNRSMFMNYLNERKYERYSVVNWNNSRTVEVRAFNSTLNPVEFYACIEFCHAMYQFTKIHDPDTIWLMGVSRVLWDIFLNYCADDKRYSHMFDVLYNEAPLSLGSNCENEAMLKDWWLTPFDSLDEFLERDEELVSGSMVALSGLVFNSSYRCYYDNVLWEPVPQPESVREHQMHREIVSSMYDDTYMTQWAEGWY